VTEVVSGAVVAFAILLSLTAVVDLLVIRTIIGWWPQPLFVLSFGVVLFFGVAAVLSEYLRGASRFLVRLLGLGAGVGFGLLWNRLDWLIDPLQMSWLGVKPWAILLGGLGVCIHLLLLISGGTFFTYQDG
jgi:hypothetical protein